MSNTNIFERIRTKAIFAKLKIQYFLQFFNVFSFQCTVKRLFKKKLTFFHYLNLFGLKIQNRECISWRFFNLFSKLKWLRGVNYTEESDSAVSLILLSQTPHCHWHHWVRLLSPNCHWCRWVWLPCVNATMEFNDAG